MVASLHAQGYRLSLWHNTYVGERQEATAALHEFAVENSFYPLVTGPILNPWGASHRLDKPRCVLVVAGQFELLPRSWH